MLQKIKHIVIGNPIPTQNLFDTKLNKIRALAAFSPDALSSITYANQEIFLGLVVAGAAGLSFAVPIAISITVLLIIVAISYSQTIHAYPSGGGSYVVALMNLGKYPGLIAGASLMIDYLLTAAVSLTAGMEALASAVPSLWPYRIIACLFVLLIIMWVNLRGIRDTGTTMSIPVYLFLFTYLILLVVGFFRLYSDGPSPITTNSIINPEPVTLLLILHTFSTGCTALTGIEAISNGVPSFQKPESRNAIKTLAVMAVLMGILFLGSTTLIQYLGVLATSQETILSALSRRLVGSNYLFVIIQAVTMLVLIVAANTSFTGFPRLTAILASDGFLPRQFSAFGDRLVYTNGIIMLTLLTGALIVIFKANSHELIPLFAIGAFLAFTFSQVGMTVHWFRIRGSKWLIKASSNFLGALATGFTVILISYNKLLEGAWITIILIILLVWAFLKIHRHYDDVRNQLSLQGLPPDIRPQKVPRIVIPISGVHRGVINAVDFARGISEEITAVYIELEPNSGKTVQQVWNRWFPDVSLVILPSPFRSIVGPLLNFLDQIDCEHNDGQLAAVVLPEFVPAKWWHAFLHNQTTWLLKTALLYRRRNSGYQRIIIDVPYHLRK